MSIFVEVIDSIESVGVFNKKNKGEVFNRGGPGPDMFRIDLDTPLVLSQRDSPGLFGRNVSRGKVSVLTHQRFGGLVADVESVPWSPSDHYGLEYPGETRQWRNELCGITIQVRNDRSIEWIRANASRLATGRGHNGHHVGTREMWDAALQRLWAVLLPLCEQDTPPEFRFHTLEIGLVARVPYSKIESLLAGRNYPGMRSPPLHYVGDYVKFGTSSKGSNFSLRIYDKGRHLNKKQGLNLELDTFTRIEFVFRKGRLRKAFGGSSPDKMTLSRMEDVFYDALYRLDEGQQDRSLVSLPASKAGLLALTISLYDACPSPKPMEHPSLWWLRGCANKPNARKLIRDAQALAGAWRGENLRELVPRGVEPQSLPAELDWNSEEAVNTNPTGL